MRRERALGVVLLMSAALVLANYLAFVYPVGPERLREVLAPGLRRVEGECFGLLPPREVPGVLSVRPGRVVCEGGAPVYESLYVSLRLTPGSWTVRLGSFYSRTLSPLVVLVLVEVPFKDVDAELVVVGEGWVAGLPMAGGHSREVLVLEGESRLELLLRARARGPASEPFRVGFHASVAG